MSTKFEYEPRMRSGKDSKIQSGKNEIDSDINKCYQDYSSPSKDLENIKYYPRSHSVSPSTDFYSTSSISSSNMTTGTTFTLGSHWKQVATVHENETTTNGTISSQTLTIPIMKTMKKVPSYEISEIRRILNNQNDKMDNIKDILKTTRQNLNNSLQKLAKNYDLITTENNNKRNKIEEELDELENKNDEFNEEFNEKLETFLDICYESIDIIDNKNRISNFIETTSKHLIETSNTTLLIESNLNRIQQLKHLVDIAIGSNIHSNLTIFEHENDRIYQVINKLNEFIQKLPLNLEERKRIEKKMDENEGKMKYEMVFRELLIIMSEWNNMSDASKTNGSIKNGNWKNIKDAFDSSSFYLTSDSNLSDLEQELQSSRIKKAVDCYEFEPWTTASSISNWSSSGKTSIHSVNEPMSLSSYEIISSSLGSSDSQFENDYGLIKTALSVDSIVDLKPPRSSTKLENEKKFEDSKVHPTFSSQTSKSDTFSCPSISLIGMVDEGINTAKEYAQNSSFNLLTSLQQSANKCGVSISNLMSGSSSESESGTQSSTPTRSVRTSAEKTEFT